MYGFYVSKNLGVNYVEPWAHPLSPYQQYNDGATSALKGAPGRLSYRYWLGLVINQESSRIKPARIVLECYRRVSQPSVSELLGSKLLLWAFGYDMDNMKARAWQESVMPIYVVSLGIRADFEEVAAQLIKAANLLVSFLTDALKKGLYRDRKLGSRATSSSFFQDATTRFWHGTEPLFYNFLERARKSLSQGDDLLPLRQQWLDILRKDHLLRLYDEITQYGAFHGADPKSVALARKDLDESARANTKKGKKVREALDLPAPSRKKR